jgi:hypothetical protein
MILHKEALEITYPITSLMLLLLVAQAVSLEVLEVS